MEKIAECIYWSLKSWRNTFITCGALISTGLIIGVVLRLILGD